MNAIITNLNLVISGLLVVVVVLIVPTTKGTGL